MDKIRHITFNSAEEAIEIVNFLSGLGYKFPKKLYDKDTYVYSLDLNIPYQYKNIFSSSIFGSFVGQLKYNGFIKCDDEWILNSGTSNQIFTYTINGRKLIRREKLKKLKNLNETKDAKDFFTENYE